MVKKCLGFQGIQPIPDYQPYLVVPISAHTGMDLRRLLILFYLLVDFCVLRW